MVIPVPVIVALTPVLIGIAYGTTMSGLRLWRDLMEIFERNGLE